MIQKFIESGYEVVDFAQCADIYIVNTCTVTSISDKKSRQILRRAKSENNNSIVVAVGCYAQIAKKELEKIDEIDLILGTNEKNDIVFYIEKYINDKNGKIENVSDIMKQKEYIDFGDVTFSDKTREVVKIEDGCDRFCSYCIIPYARGRVRSRDISSIINEIKKIANNGVKEVVLTGIHTGSYGYGTEHDLTDLIHEISQFEGLKRIRISSIEVTELNDKFLEELASNPKICNHMHIPLQAGSDEILKRMNRKYTLEEFGAKLKQIREIRPDIAITTDIIVGFPGETEELFLKTMATAKEFQFSKIHVFPYSLREGTKAAIMDGHVSNEEKHERSKRLTELSKELERDYAMKFLGKEVDVLIERNNEGFTSNYLRVRSDQDISNNTLVTLEIVDIQNDECVGKVVS